MRKNILEKIAYLSVNRTWLMSIAIILVTIFLGYRASTLQFRTGFDNMLPGDNPRTAEFNRILDEFQNDSNIILLARGEEDDLKAYGDHIELLLETFTDWVREVHVKVPKTFYRKNALKLMKSEQIENFGEMFSDPNLIPFLQNLNDAFEKEYQGDNNLDSQRDELEAVRFLDGLEQFVALQKQVMSGSNDKNIGQLAVDAITIGESYLLSPDKDMILIMIEPAFNMLSEVGFIVEVVDGLEEIAKREGNKMGVRAGLTGSMVLQRDEMHAMEEDSFTVTTLALIGIFILFVLSFRMLVSPLLAIITVIIGVAWAMGIASFLVDYLSLLTAMMSVILVGLGIDFSIHIISGYTEKRHEGLAVYIAMRETLQRFGPGVITGGITTGMAFLTMVVSETLAMQEFGLMAGFGIITTMAATIIILPTMLIIRERILGKFNKSLKTKDVSYGVLGATAEYIARIPKPLTVVFLLITAFLFFRSSKLTMDYNYLNMEPLGLESIKLQDELIDEFDLSSDFVMFTADNLEDVRILTDKARDMTTTGYVESISDYLPNKDDEARQFRFIKELRRKIKDREIRRYMSSRDMVRYNKEIQRLEANIIELQDLSFLGGQDRVYEKAVRLVGEAGDTLARGLLTTYINDLDTGLAIIELTFFQQQFASAFKSTILEMANTEPLALENLPEDIKNRFTGKSGEIFLITVYPKANIWEDTRFLYRFNEEATELSERATGLPPIFVELMDTMGKDGRKATWLALLAVFLVLWLDFRNVRYALLGMTPLVFGVIWMTGIMELLGQQLNMVNIIAVPLIIGIGIDDGVHILHRWRLEKNLDIVYRSTGKAILLTSLTTMLGFGSLWFATYRGLGSMGIALFIGVGTCFLATLFIIPTILGFKYHRNPE